MLPLMKDFCHVVLSVNIYRVRSLVLLFNVTDGVQFHVFLCIYVEPFKIFRSFCVTFWKSNGSLSLRLA